MVNRPPKARRSGPELIFGFTGPFASGKDFAASVVSRHVTRHGHPAAMSMTSDQLRAHCIRKGYEPHELTRTVLRHEGNQLRQKRGPGVLAALCMAELRRKTDAKVGIVGGIRHPGEVQALRERYGSRFHLIAVDAPARVRYKRLLERQREGEHKLSWQEFKASETAEQGSTTHGQNIPAVLEMADHTVANDGSPAQFEHKLSDLVERVLKKHGMTTLKRDE